jgi:hypothetical protein
MSVNPESLRLPLIYTAIMALAAVLGGVLAAGEEVDALVLIVALFGLLVSPLVLKWHRAMLFFCWNSTLGTYFLPGQAPLWLSLGAVSLLLTMVDRTLHQGQPLVSQPAIAWPLVVFAGVVVVTMLATGGVGIQWLGESGLSGGRKYMWILCACLGYFALTGVVIPVEKAPLFYGLFFLGGLTGFVGPLAGWLGGPVAYLQYVFSPVEGVAQTATGFRVKGLSSTGAAIVAWLLARYGFGGVFHSERFWRIGLLGLGMLLGLMSGYRTALVTYAIVLAMMFFLEGHHRTPRLLVWAGAGLLGVALLIPLTPHLPTPVQRSLSFLPLPVDPIVRFEAEGTLSWRESLWKELLEDVPQYFWLGKGMTVSTVDMESAKTFEILGASRWYVSYLTGEHHNGFLSVIIPFGIWGLLALLWLLGAGLWVLARNFRHGRAELRSVNAYLLASYVAWMVLYFSYWGTLYWALRDATGLLALGVALNAQAARTEEDNAAG